VKNKKLDPLKANTIIKSLYGSVAILKGYCPKCRHYSFVIDGLLKCCNTPFDETLIQKERIKREIEGESERSRIPEKVKKQILERQGNRCIYCDCALDDYVWNSKRTKYEKIKIHFDHFVAWDYSRDNKEYNIYASCHICNLIKSDKYFYDLTSAREYILSERKKKGYVVGEASTITGEKHL